MRRFVAVLLIGVPLLFGVMAVILGQDSNWDLRNYHWYNAYAAVHGRFDFDVGAAQTPTYYNPTLDVPFYLAAANLPAKVFSFLFGALQGCNFILLYLIAMRTLKMDSPRRQAAASIIIAFVGMIGAGQLAQLGAMFYDNIVSLFILAAVAVLLHSKDLLLQGPIRRALLCSAFAGFLVGCGVGLKLPTQIFAVGVCFGLLFIPGPFMRRFFLSFTCGLGIIAGFLLCGGWWLWEMWTHFGNPLFPYFNDVIKSPWALPFSYRDERYLPTGIVNALTLPFRLFVDAKVVGEIDFRDGRILSAYVILIATAGMLLLQRLEKNRWNIQVKAAAFADTFAVRYLVALTALSYIVWLKMFGIYRYMLPLEMLAPLLIVGCLAFWPVSRVRQASLAVAVLGFLVITMQPGNWGRKPWGDGWGGKVVDVKLPPIADPANTMVVMAGLAPTSFLIPAFPPEIPFLRPHSFVANPLHPTKLTTLMQDRIDAHKGDLLLLQARWEQWPGVDLLPVMGLAVVPGGCKPIWDNLDGELELCRLIRTSDPLPDSPPTAAQTPEPPPKS